VPVYEYDCQACGARFEELAPAGCAPTCPACGNEQTVRRWSQLAPPRVPVGLTGRAAAKSDSKRAAREEARRERSAAARERRQKGD
jgi:putative FmdB family regulatory protein